MVGSAPYALVGRMVNAIASADNAATLRLTNDFTVDSSV
jgi:hypothetical protein